MTTCVVGLSKGQLMHQIIAAATLLRETPEDTYRAMINEMHDNRVGYELEYMLRKPFCAPPFIQKTDDGFNFNGLGRHAMLFNPGNVRLSTSYEVAVSDHLALVPFYFSLGDLQRADMPAVLRGLIDDQMDMTHAILAIMRQFWVFGPTAGAMPLELKPAFECFEDSAQTLGVAIDQLGWNKHVTRQGALGVCSVAMLTAFASVPPGKKHNQVRLHVTVIKPPKEPLTLS